MSDLSFLWPGMLAALLLIPLLVLAYLAAQRRRRAHAIRFTNLALLGSVVTAAPAWRRHVPPALFLLALTVLVVALARPQYSVATKRQEGTVILATDVSGSMQATDVKPDRLTAARAAAKEFAGELPERFKLGLIAFSQGADLLVPPTTDREAVDQALDTLQPNGGTAMGDALLNAVETLRPVVEAARAAGEPRAPATILLLSDGENTAGAAQPLEAAEQAKALGIPINTVALGTDEGAITVPDPLTGQIRTIEVPPDRATLRAIARTTGGRAFEAFDAERLAGIYESIGARISGRKQQREITVGFAGGGIVLLLAAGLTSLLWFGRLP